MAKEKEGQGEQSDDLGRQARDESTAVDDGAAAVLGRHEESQSANERMRKGSQNATTGEYVLF